MNGTTMRIGGVAVGAAAAVAVAVGALAVAALPAWAHGTTATTAPGAGTTPAPPGGMAGLAGVTGAAATAGSDSAEAGWSGLGVSLAVTAAATVALVAWRRRDGGRPRASGVGLAAAAALLFAGVAHCALAPSHWAEGWHLGLFFAGSGLVLVVQGAAAGLRPTPAVYWSVLASTAALAALYFVGREVALPLVDHQDPYLLTDVPVKGAEAAAALVAGLALMRRRVAAASLPPRPGHRLRGHDHPNGDRNGMGDGLSTAAPAHRRA